MTSLSHPNAYLIVWKRIKYHLTLKPVLSTPALLQHYSRSIGDVVICCFLICLYAFLFFNQMTSYMFPNFPKVIKQWKIKSPCSGRQNKTNKPTKSWLKTQVENSQSCAMAVHCDIPRCHQQPSMKQCYVVLRDAQLQIYRLPRWPYTKVPHTPSPKLSGQHRVYTILAVLGKPSPKPLISCLLFLILNFPNSSS